MASVAGRTTPSSERAEWRRLAGPLATLVATFGAAWAWSAVAAGVSLGAGAAVAYGVAVLWTLRAAVGAVGASDAPLTGAALEAFRDRQFGSRAARGSYAVLLICDGFFLLEYNPGQPGLFFVFAALAALCAPEIGLTALVLALLHFA